MPFVLIVVGIVILVTAINGTTGKLAGLLKTDVFGQNGYIYWAVAVGVVGAIGYINAFKRLSDWFIVLILLALVLNNRGIFQQFSQVLKGTASASSGTTTAPGMASNGLAPSSVTSTVPPSSSPSTPSVTGNTDAVTTTGNLTSLQPLSDNDNYVDTGTFDYGV